MDMVEGNDRGGKRRVNEQTLRDISKGYDKKGKRVTGQGSDFVI